MTERNRARRHRGKHKPYYKRGEQAIPDVPLDTTTMTYWQSVMDAPLFVYFIQAEDGGPVKIGQALEPAKRMRELQCGNPRELVIRAVILAEVETERGIQFMWRPHAHVRGEWYGQGYEDALVCLARVAAQAQVDAHKDGAAPHQVAEFGTHLIEFPSMVAA